MESGFYIVGLALDYIKWLRVRILCTGSTEVRILYIGPQFHICGIGSGFYALDPVWVLYSLVGSGFHVLDSDRNFMHWGMI